MKQQSTFGFVASLAITGVFIYGLFWVASKGWNAGK
jgi:hypothetical protein